MIRFDRTYGAAVLTGVLLAVSFPGWQVYPLAWCALAPLLVVSHGKPAHDTAGLFFVAGWTFYSLLLQWLLANVYWAGGWAIVGQQLLAVVMAGYWALLGWVYGAFFRGRGWRELAALPFLWTGMELSQSVLFTGFGWGAIGYSQGADLAAAQWAAIGGVSLVSFFVVLVNILLAAGLSRRKKGFGYILAAVVTAGVVHGGGILLMKPAEYGADPFNVVIFQSDFPLEMKWDPEYTVDMVQRAADFSRMADRDGEADLFLWPEALIMTDTTDPQIFPVLERLTRETETPLFTGTTRTDAGSGREYNSAVFVDADGAMGEHYDKIHLAPFGEYVPLSRYFPFIGKIIPAIGDMAAGDRAVLFDVNGRRLGPLICFEVLFGSMAERLRSDGADVIAVITNLGWFGASSAISQEFELARMRAIETRLPVLHAANTGISGVFDPYGRFSSIVPQLEPRAIIMRRAIGMVAVPLPGDRPLARGPQAFSWFFGLMSIALILFALITRTKGKHDGHG